MGYLFLNTITMVLILTIGINELIKIKYIYFFWVD